MAAGTLADNQQYGFRQDSLRNRRELNDAQNGSPDDRAIYQALARQKLGDPQNFKYILNEVLHHYLQTWFNQKRPLHQTYRQYDKPVANFHSYLSKPGLSDSPLILQRVLTVALNAL
ncbi:hypothetical protein IWX91DRAFT_320271 [Phyllosticta citricarpa]